MHHPDGRLQKKKEATERTEEKEATKLPHPTAAQSKEARQKRREHMKEKNRRHKGKEIEKNKVSVVCCGTYLCGIWL